MNGSPDYAEHWWEFLAGGSALLLGIVITTSILGDLGEGAWLLMVVLLLGAVLAIGTGLSLGAAHLAGRRH